MCPRKTETDIWKEVTLMQRRTIITTLASLSILALPLAASAISYLDPSDSLGLGTADLKDTVINIINWVLGLLGIVAVIMVLYGGFQWLTAGGSEDKVASAKKILQSAVIGLIIILLAWAIVNYVLSTAGNVSGV